MYSELNLDLQAFAKRVYDSILYNSTFYKFLNGAYIGELRQTGAPVIEVAKTDALSVHVRSTKEIQTALDPALTTYHHTMVDLTELNMDYAIRVPLMVAGSGIINAIQDAVDLEDSAIAKQIDTYGYGKLASASMEEAEWDPSTQQDYIDLLTGLKAKLFNKDIYGDYRLGLGATEYGRLVSALTSVLKFETLAGREGVDMGEVGRAYGVDAIFPINDSMLNDEKGYFFNPIAVVGDTFFSASAFVQTASDIRYPGYYCISGTQSFGAEVVRPEAIIRLVEEVSA